jgi:ABC-type transport system involved in multi-copper enzyme maturation permease subunit
LSVYKHNYRAYTGRVTPLWSRVAVVARYGLQEIWSSKISIGLFTLSLLPSIVFLVLIYVSNNPIARMLITRGNAQQGLPINGEFFLVMLEIQCWFALVITAWIAPRLITFDLADNALPILLSHPISRIGYVTGKFARG